MNLKVIAHIDTTRLEDADDIPMSTWRAYDKLPCYYLGAWEGSLDFLGANHQLVLEQRKNPQRNFFVFNKVPKTLVGIIEAIKEWAKE